ncbi:major facilitator superfamily MFS_1 [Spirochaeta thermophila DSM 6578]|uniref:Major facilitator superfamily MFS_1 n=1 Tax=Winmispira thermophila (strain ATCC 700085 / DSM 6578 / Z-1203) TaxID=869211 RepID=G0GEE1_WINT7|nr:MFS transporter [Spirochaeta thermophila]AEJ62278.1 major facilitator superfamily MFS_1 [Spirochaeta thermophila DSM 6578]
MVKGMTTQERSWVLYDWANSAHTMIVMTVIFPMFFKGVLASGMEAHRSTALLGYANSAASLVVAFLAPILGALADYRNSKKRFFSVFFTMGVLATAGIAFVLEGQWSIGLLLFVISVIGFSGANIFYDSFVVDVTSSERMDWVSASGYGWGYIGGSIPFLLAMVLILLHKQLGLESQVPMVRASFLIAAAWWAVFSIPFFLFVKQNYFVEHAGRPVREAFSRLYHTFRNVAHYRALFVFLLAYFFYIDGVVTIIKMAIPIGMDIGLGQTTLLVVLLVVQFVAFPFSLIYGRLAERFSTRTMLFVGIATYFVITLLATSLPFIPSLGVKTAVFWLIAVLVGTAQGGVQSLSRSYYGRLVPKEKSAEFFGFFDVMGKFAAIMGPALVGAFTDLTRHTAAGIFSVNLLFLIGLVLLLVERNLEKRGV